MYTLIKQHKTQNPHHKLNNVIEKFDHNVLLLLLDHPEFNPIEKIWDIVKDSVGARNATFKLFDIEILVGRQEFSAFTRDKWISICNNANKKEGEYMQ